MNADADALEWAGLAYKLPTHPSKYRVYVWRKLKQAGAIFYQQGVAVLPMNPWNHTYLEGLREEIRKCGGEAAVLSVRISDKEDEDALIAQFNENMRSVCQGITRCLLDCLDGLDAPSPGLRARRQSMGFFEKARRSYESCRRHGLFQAPLDPSAGRTLETLMGKVEKRAHGTEPAK